MSKKPINTTQSSRIPAYRGSYEAFPVYTEPPVEDINAFEQTMAEEQQVPEELRRAGLKVEKVGVRGDISAVSWANLTLMNV